MHNSASFYLDISRSPYATATAGAAFDVVIAFAAFDFAISSSFMLPELPLTLGDSSPFAAFEVVAFKASSISLILFSLTSTWAFRVSISLFWSSTTCRRLSDSSDWEEEDLNEMKERCPWNFCGLHSNCQLLPVVPVAA